MKATGKTVLLIFAAATVFFSSSCIRENTPEGADLQPGDRIPEFSVTMSDGSVAGTETLGGKVSLIVFFHTGCPDCREELPVIQKIYDNYSPGVNVCCISREESATDIASYWDEAGFTMPYSAQEDRRIYSLFARTGVPRVYVVTPDLMISSVYDDSPVATYSQLAADIASCM